MILTKINNKALNQRYQRYMLDLYLIITPIFGFLSLVTIVNLKFTLKQPNQKDLKKYEKKSSQNNNIQIEPSVKLQVKDQALDPGYKKTLSYLLKNFTIVDFCLVRRSRNKIPLLLSLSIIAILQLALNIPYVFSLVGTLTTLFFVAGKVLTDQQYDETNDLARIRQRVKQGEQTFQQKSQVALTSLTLLLNVIFIGLTFKNYRNGLLQSAALNFIIAVALDNFIVKPLALSIVAYPCKNIQFVDSFINKEIQVLQILHQQRVPKRIFDANISALSPKKLRSSPSKIPKAVLVQPRINLENKQNYLSTIQLTKALRKPKLSPINSKKSFEPHNSDDCSLISIMNSHQKKAFEKNSSFEFDKSMFEQKVHEENQPIRQVQFQPKSKQDENQNESKYSIDAGKKSSKMQSSKLIMVSQDHSIINNFENIDVQNEQDEDLNQNKSSANQKSLRESDYKAGSRNCDGLKISLHKSIDYDNENKQNFDAFFEDQEVNPYQDRPHSTLEDDNSILGYGTITHTSRRDGLLKIYEDRRGQDLEQIDLNSPERRKQQLGKIVEDANAQKPKKKKKGYKKYSLDPNRHVIKHSTGQPYLEFLPNLLNKERQQKKKKTLNNQGSQQAFSRKMDMMNGYVNQSRLTKSVKRPKNGQNVIMKENDQNKIPEFIIEDFN